MIYGYPLRALELTPVCVTLVMIHKQHIQSRAIIQNPFVTNFLVSTGKTLHTKMIIIGTHLMMEQVDVGEQEV